MRRGQKVCYIRWLLFILALAAAAGNCAAQSTNVEYLGDQPELILSATPGWGEMGWNLAAHAPGQTGAPLQIGSRTFAKGLGHHANGDIVVDLDGRFTRFEALVGLQPCGSSGSLVFRVIVDGAVRFDSGVMKADNEPKLADVDLSGAQELQLQASDAGDGIACDMANWVEARLTRATGQAVAPRSASVNVADFARVLTWDPQRANGAHAGRLEEYRTEDILLERPVARDAMNYWPVPVWTNEVGCIGLQWLNQRSLRELELEFAAGAPIPKSDQVELQGWFGESQWQGTWKTLTGDWHSEGAKLVFHPTGVKGAPASLLTQKVRWIFRPVTGRLLIARLAAFTRSRWGTANIICQAERPEYESRGSYRIINGGIEGAPEASIRFVDWPLGKPVQLAVRYSLPSALNTDPTMIQFRMPAGACAVSLADVLTNPCVYVPVLGLYVATNPPRLSFAQYKFDINTRKTVIEEVRARPDQTFAQAMQRTHHAAQDDGPVLLSLACDSTKFIVERDGTVRFGSEPKPGRGRDGLELHSHFDGNSDVKPTRHLDGGWLPVPVMTRGEGSVDCIEKVFVAPAAEPAGPPPAWSAPSVCVVEFQLTNRQAAAAQVQFSFDCVIAGGAKPAIEIHPQSQGFELIRAANLIGLVETNGLGPLRLEMADGHGQISGLLPGDSAARCVMRFPGNGAKPDLALNRTVAELLTATKAYWQRVLEPGIHIQTPEPLLDDIIRSSIVRCYIDARDADGGKHVATWIAAMSYGPLESESHSVIRGMDYMGQAEFGRRSLDFFVRRYNTNGFLTTGYTTFGTAWHLWTLAEHYRLYRDNDWLRNIAPEVTRVCNWVVTQLGKTAAAARVSAEESIEGVDPSLAPPIGGLMPPGVLADWNAYACYFSMNAYYFAALNEVGAVLSDVAKSELRADASDRMLSGPRTDLTSARGLQPGDLEAHAPGGVSTNGEYFVSCALQLKTNILRAYAWTQAQAPVVPLRNGHWVPYYPSQVHSPGKLADFFPGQDGGRSWCYDVELGAHQMVAAGVLPPDDAEVSRMMDHLEDAQFLADGWGDYPATGNRQDWFSLGGFSKVQPYYTRNVEIYGLRDDVRPFIRSYFNTLAAMISPEVLTFWEHFNHGGAWDKTHETGYFLQQTRTMFLTARGDELWIAPFVTANWMKDGLSVSVSNAPSRFGPVTYQLVSHAKEGFLEAAIQTPTRIVPKSIVLRLRHPDGQRIRLVTLDGESHADFDPARDTITFEPSATTNAVRKVVARY